MKILVIDDHALFREGIRWILERMGAETEIIEASGVEEGLAALRSHGNVDLVLLDLYLPGYHGIEALKCLRKEYPTGRIVLLSGSDDPTLIREGIANGAQGFIHKSVTADSMLEAVGAALRDDACHAAAEMPPAASAGAAAIAQLTARQRQILAQVCEGKSYKEIARELDISDFTVRNHVLRIFAILGVHSRTEAAVLAYRHKLIA